MKYLAFFFAFFSIPVLANSYTDIGGTSQMIADEISNFWTFLFEDTPNLIERWLGYAVIWWTKVKLYAYFEFMKLAWNVAKVVIADLNIMSQITAQISALPQDVKTMLVQTRLFDGMNIVLNAYVTRFVMRFI